MTKTLTEQIVHIQNDLDVVFDEVVKLENKLKIATKALKLYAELNIVGEEAREALKEMEGVK